MAIESVSGNTSAVSLPAKPASKDVSTSKPTQTAATNASDPVEFSAVSQELKTAVAASGTVPVINEDRVAAIKSAIQAGTYQPDANRIAGKILQFDKQLANST